MNEKKIVSILSYHQLYINHMIDLEYNKKKPSMNLKKKNLILTNFVASARPVKLVLHHFASCYIMLYALVHKKCA